MIPSATTERALSRGESEPALSDGAAKFVTHWELGADLSPALRLIAELFTVNSVPVVEKTEDPEFPDEWINISIHAVGDVKRIADTYDEFVRQWVQSTPVERIRKVRLAVA